METPTREMSNISKEQLCKSFRAVMGYKGQRNQHQQIVYDFIEKTSKRTANLNSQTGCIDTNNTVAQAAVSHSFNKLLQMMDSKSSDEEQTTHIKK